MLNPRSASTRLSSLTGIFFGGRTEVEEVVSSSKVERTLCTSFDR